MEKKTLSALDIENYFQGLSSSFSKNYQLKGVKKNTLKVLDYLFNLKLNNKTVLETGCGSRGLLIEFLKRYYDYVIGFDVSDDMISNAMKLTQDMGSNSKSLFLKSDFNELDFNQVATIRTHKPEVIIADRAFCRSPVSLQILDWLLVNDPEYIVITLPRKNVLYRKGWRAKLKIRNMKLDIKSQFPAHYYFESDVYNICQKRGYKLDFHFFSIVVRNINI